jgi:4-amino-4-deoxy-L-arabinose transferase-like glycosyltransferase
MTEILLAPFTVAGVLTLLVSLRQAGFRDSLGWMILSGLMFGMAVLIKLVPVAPAGAAVGIALLYRLLDRDLAFGRVIALGLAALFGVTAPLLLSALVYAGLGEWHAFYVSNLGFAGSYVHSSDSPSRLLSALLRISAGVWPLLMFAAIGVADDVRRVAAGKPPGFSQAVLMAWLLGELIASSSTLHFYPHYFLMTLPPLCLLAAMGVARSVRWALGAGRVSRGVVGLSLVLLLVPVAPVLALQGPTMLSGFDIWRAAAAEIRKDSAGRKPTLFVLTQGQLALYPMTGADLPTPKAQPAQLLSDDKTMTDTANRAEYQRILATRPEFIVLDQTEEPPAWVYEGLSPWVACCYTRVATVRDFLNFDMGVNRRHDVDIYQLRASALPSTRDAPARSPDRP